MASRPLGANYTIQSMRMLHMLVGLAGATQKPNGTSLSAAISAIHLRLLNDG
jgi:hypothetical protein